MWIIYETVSVQTWSPNARTQCHFHTIPYRFQSSVAATPTPELRRSPTRCLVTMPFAGNLLYSFSIYFPPPASSAWVYFLNASSVSQSGPIYWWPAISFIQKSRKNQTAVYDSQVLWVPQVPWKTKMRQKQPVSSLDLNTPESWYSFIVLSWRQSTFCFKSS